MRSSTVSEGTSEFRTIPISLSLAVHSTGSAIDCQVRVRHHDHAQASICSEKLNKAGNPYKDIVALEAIDTPATTTSAGVPTLSMQQVIPSSCPRRLLLAFGH